MPSEVRRFACTACGRCCTRGPEMELGEAAGLANTFILSLLFKVHSLPISDRSGWAGHWWQGRNSRIPLRPALDEAERHLRLFATRSVDKSRDRQLFLEISVIVEDDGAGRCPALEGDLCSIHETRPQTCRTVPLHYSRAPSTLERSLDQFAATPGFSCDTTPSAPAILDGNRILDPQLSEDRTKAVALAKADRGWKDQMLALMKDASRVAATGLPHLDAVLANSDNGYATLLPMIVAWRVAADAGYLSRAELSDLCRKQADLIRRKIAGEPGKPAAKGLLDTLAMYESELSEMPPLAHFASRDG